MIWTPVGWIPGGRGGSRGVIPARLTRALQATEGGADPARRLGRCPARAGNHLPVNDMHPRDHVPPSDWNAKQRHAGRRTAAMMRRVCYGYSVSLR